MFTNQNIHTNHSRQSLIQQLKEGLGKLFDQVILTQPFVYGWILLHFITTAVVLHSSGAYLSLHSSFLMLCWFIYLVNGTLGLFVLRTELSSKLFSFIFLLAYVSWMMLSFLLLVAGTGQLPEVLVYRLGHLLLSFFPFVLFYFFVTFAQPEKYNRRFVRLFFYQTFLLSVVRELISSEELFEGARLIFFLLNLFIVLVFTLSMYRGNFQLKKIFPNRKDRWLVWVSALSFVPFILFSLGPALFIHLDGIVRNYWTIYFILFLPLLVAELISRDRLVVHRYTKIPLYATFFLIFGVNSLLNILLGWVIQVDGASILLFNYYLLAFVFTCTLCWLGYSEWRKQRLVRQMTQFEEEKIELTHHLLYQSHTEQVWALVKELFQTHFNSDECALVVYGTAEDEVFTTPAFSFLSEVPSKQMKTWLKDYEDVFFLPLHQESTEIGLLALHREGSFSYSEQRAIRSYTAHISSLLSLGYRLSMSQIEKEDRAYTALEKATYFKELDLSDFYHQMISHYLHDEILQPLLHLRQSTHTFENEEMLHEHLDNLAQLIEESIRRKLIDWEPSALENQSVKERLAALTNDLVSRYHTFIPVSLAINEFVTSALPLQMKQMTYRIVRELLVNSYKHSQASRIEVGLDQSTRWLTLWVTDDGVGIPEIEHSPFENGFGLLSIKQQVTAMNGEMIVKNNTEKGLTVKVYIPIEENEW